MLDSTTDAAMPDEWRRRNPSRPADPSLFDFTGPAIGTASPQTGPENP